MPTINHDLIDIHALSYEALKDHRRQVDQNVSTNWKGRRSERSRSRRVDSGLYSLSPADRTGSRTRTPMILAKSTKARVSAPSGSIKNNHRACS